MAQAPDPYWLNGRRMQALPNATDADLDQIAQGHGYNNAAAAMASEGRSASELAQQWGVPNYHPEGGTTDTQVADSDKDYGPLLMGLAASPLLVGLGGVGLSALAGGGAAAGGGSSLPAAFGGGGAVTTAAGEGALAAGSAASGVGGGLAAGVGGTAATAGTLPTIFKTAGEVGKGLSAITSGAAQGRAAEATANQQQSRAELDRYTAALRANQQATDTQQTDYRNAIRGGLLKGIQDFQVTPPANIASHMGTITGGLRPSAISGGADIGDQMQRQALLDLMSGQHAGAGLAGQAAGPPLPAAPVQPQQSGASRALGYVGPALNIASLVGQALR